MKEELLKIRISDFRKELSKCSEIGFKHGIVCGIQSVIKGLAVVVKKEVEPPITPEDIVDIVKSWLSHAEKEFEKTKKEYNLKGLK